MIRCTYSSRIRMLPTISAGRQFKWHVSLLLSAYGHLLHPGRGVHVPQGPRTPPSRTSFMNSILEESTTSRNPNLPRARLRPTSPWCTMRALWTTTLPAGWTRTRTPWMRPVVGLYQKSAMGIWLSSYAGVQVLKVMFKINYIFLRVSKQKYIAYQRQI